MLASSEKPEDNLDCLTAAISAATNWIENVIEQPINAENGFRRALVTGEVLCRLLNAALPGTVKRINHCPNRAAAADNLTLFLSSCEEKFGVLRSRLFSLGDFEDIFEQKNDCQVTEKQGAKETEKVVIALFWLAKAIELKPSCRKVPHLDYGAFIGLLPKQAIYHTPVTSSGDNDSVRSRNSISLERKSSFACEVALEPHYFVRPQSSSTMGNTQPPSLPARQSPSVLQRAQTLPAQTNNSALDEDEWQTDLDDWREKRRKASRLQATKMFILEEQRREDERKHQAAIRARMQEIKSHRTSVTSSYIPSTDISQLPPVTSPGMALLTGAAFDLSEISDASVLSAIAPYGTYNRSKITDSMDDQPSSPMTDGRSQEVPDNHEEANAHVGENLFISKKDELAQSREFVTDECRPKVLSPEVSDVSEAHGVHNIVIRLQPKTGIAESRWGMTVRAEGPNSDAPFVVDRVKIGSSADVCDVIKGDMLVQLNGVDLRRSVTSKNIFTLHDLEQLMDELALSGKTTNLTVLRHASQQEELSEIESSEQSDGERSTLNVNSGNTEAATASLSDLDVTVAPSTVMVNGEGSNESPLIAAAEQLFVHSVPPIEIPQSDTVLRPVQSSSSMGQLINPSSDKSEIRESLPDDENKGSGSPKTAPSTNHMTPLVTSLRSPLSTQMIDAAEAGASQLNTPSQVEDSISSKKNDVLSNGRHVDITGTEPTYMILATTGSQQSESQTDYQIKLPYLFKQETESPILPKCEPMNAGDCSSDAPQVFDSVSISTSQSSSSSLPPPPSLPLRSSPSPSLPSDKTDLQKLINFEFYPLAQLTDPGTDQSTHTDGPVHRFASDSEHNYELPSSGNDVAFRSLNLPSPPPPHFFSSETAPVVRRGLGDQQSQVTKTNGRPTISNSTTKGLHLDHIHSDEHDYSWDVRKDPAGRDMRLDPSLCSNLNSCTDSHFSRIVTPSPKLPTTPPPAPSSPLLPPLINERSRTMPMKVDPICESEELVIDDLEDSKDPIVYKRHEPHPRLYAPPPLPKVNRSDPPPQPPRVPMNRLVNQKQKCIACTRELGSGDLMLIESMNLYYHLACFVCSRCGVALSDGLSNTDVRIRCGQLYCNDCYPSRQSKGIQQLGTGSHRNRNTIARTNTPVNCADRRSRPRSQCNQSRGNSATSGLYLRYNR